MSFLTRETTHWIETDSPKVRIKVDVSRLIVAQDMFISSNIDAEPESEARKAVAEILAGVIVEWDVQENGKPIEPAPEFLATVKNSFLKDLHEKIKQVSQPPQGDKEAYTKWLVSDGVEGRVPDWVTLIEVSRTLRIGPWDAEKLTLEQANQAVDYLNYQLAADGAKRRFPHF